MPTLAELAFAEANLLKCKGYDPKFINKNISISATSPLSATMKKALPDVKGDTKGILKYTAMSVLFNKKRKVPFYAAYNIDGKEKSNKTARPKFQTDPRFNAEQQLGYPFYDLRTGPETEFEIGHMASNNEMGRGKEGKLKAFQTFHFTNSVPQAEKLNSGIWQGLEAYIIKEAATIKKNKRICVFTGPLLTSKDPRYVEDESFKIPLLFFKVIIFPTTKGVYSTAFIMSHEKRMIEQKMFAGEPEGLAGEGMFDDFKYRKVFQVNLSLLENETGLKFSWPGVKRIKVPNEKNQVKKIRSIRDAEDAKKAIKTGGMPESLSRKIQPSKKDKAKKDLEKGLVPESLLSNANVTKKELKKGNYRLNLILP